MGKLAKGNIVYYRPPLSAYLSAAEELFKRGEISKESYLKIKKACEKKKVLPEPLSAW